LDDIAVRALRVDSGTVNRLILNQYSIYSILDRSARPLGRRAITPNCYNKYSTAHPHIFNPLILPVSFAPGRRPHGVQFVMGRVLVHDHDPPPINQLE